MCGIFGFVGDPDRARAIDLEAALRSLRHRGPDDSGVYRSWESSNHSTEQSTRVSCAFAHTRLAIIDISAAGHQPMTTPDGRYTIVYNGEVFNFREIRAELETSSNRAIEQSRNVFRSNSDTEVILRSYERWGAECVERLRGMFAFAIWDRDERSLFLARDRLGIKPLYYVETPGGLAFSSEVRTLLATGLAARRLDHESLKGYLAFGSVQGPATIIDGVRSLSPGHSARVRDSRFAACRYWSLPADSPSRGAPDLLELHQSLRDAVRLRLISDVPLGVFLSGGIDSTAVVALAAAASDVPIHTFTVTFDEKPFNEETFAAGVASRFGCDHHQVHLSADRAAMEIEGAIRALDQPSADGVNTYFVAKAAREAGLTVALSGLGGDELFAGYRNFRRFGAILRAGAAARVLPLDDGGRGGGAFGGVPHRLRKLRALLAAGGDPARSYAVLRGMFLRDERESILAKELCARPDRGEERVPLSASSEDRDFRGRRDSVNLYSRLEISNYLRNTLLRDTDAMSMASSLEVRVPFLDHPLLEEVLAIPGKAKIAGRHNKPLLTAAVPEIPRHIVRRKKMGFTLPMDSWFRGPLKEWMSERLSEESTRSVGFLRPEGVSRLWSSFLRGERYSSWSRVWSVAALVSWCHENGVAADFATGRALRPASSELGAVRRDAVMSSPRKPVPATERGRGSLPVGVAALGKPVRVLLILPAAFATAGGIEMYNRLLVKAFGEILSESGGSCEVLVLNDRPEEFDPRYLAAGQRLPQVFARSKSRLIATALRAARKLKPELIVFGHVNFAPLALALKKVSPASKQWFMIYGIDAWERLDAIRRRALRKSDLIVSISRHTKDEFARSNGIEPDKVKLLPCALDPYFDSERTSPPVPLSSWRGGGHEAGGEVGVPTLLTVARLSKSDDYKGLDQVLRALPAVALAVPGVRYVIIGDGDGRPRLERLARELGVAERVEFRGRVSGDSLARAYAECSLFVMPSSKEGFGIVYLEAAHFGKACVVDSRGAASEVVLDGETGRVVHQDETARLEQTIIELLRNAAELDRLGRNATKRLEERYTFEGFQENLRGFLAPVLASEREPVIGKEAKQSDRVGWNHAAK